MDEEAQGRLSTPEITERCKDGKPASEIAYWRERFL